jgi:hypothetical protein
MHEFKIQLLLILANTDNYMRKLLIAQYIAEVELEYPPEGSYYDLFSSFDEIKEDVEGYIRISAKENIINLVNHYIKLSETVNEYELLKKA